MLTLQNVLLSKIGSENKISRCSLEQRLENHFVVVVAFTVRKNRSKQFDYDALKARMEKNKVLKPKPTPTEKIAEVFSPQNNV